MAVADRTALILDIFSQRARTREGKLQVCEVYVSNILQVLSCFYAHICIMGSLLWCSAESNDVEMKLYDVGCESG